MKNLVSKIDFNYPEQSEKVKMNMGKKVKKVKKMKYIQ